MGYYYEGKLGLFKSDWDKLKKEYKDIIEKEIFTESVNTFDSYKDRPVYVFSFDSKKAHLQWEHQLSLLLVTLEDENIDYCYVQIGNDFEDYTFDGRGKLEYLFGITRTIEINE